MCRDDGEFLTFRVANVGHSAASGGTEHGPIALYGPYPGGSHPHPKAATVPPAQ